MKKIDIIRMGNTIIALVNGGAEDYRINDELRVYVPEASRYIYGNDIDELLFPLVDIREKFIMSKFMVDVNYSPFTMEDKETIKILVKKINSKVREG